MAEIRRTRPGAVCNAGAWLSPGAGCGLYFFTFFLCFLRFILVWEGRGALSLLTHLRKPQFLYFYYYYYYFVACFICSLPSIHFHLGLLGSDARLARPRGNLGSPHRRHHAEKRRNALLETHRAKVSREWLTPFFFPAATMAPQLLFFLQRHSRRPEGRTPQPPRSSADRARAAGRFI